MPYNYQITEKVIENQYNLFWIFGNIQSKIIKD